MERKIEATELWLYRRMLNTSWIEQVSNLTVLQRAGARNEMMKKIRQRQWRFLGRVMRLEQVGSVCDSGKVESMRGRGRLRVKLVDSMAKGIGGGFTPAWLVQMTESRSDWLSMVANVLEDTELR